MQSNIFARLYKVDEQRREIYARAVQEAPDNSGEIFDYESSVPNFRKWSADTYRDSNGLSYGNVRAMHSNVAAGKVTDIDFNDHEKAIDVVCKILDDSEWSKCLEGVYTGLSIGGRYAKTWPDVGADGKMLRRYTAVPTEISLVDKPCIKEARIFEVRKSSGITVNRAFKFQHEGGFMHIPDTKGDEGRYATALLIKAALTQPKDLSTLTAPKGDPRRPTGTADTAFKDDDMDQDEDEDAVGREHEKHSRKLRRARKDPSGARAATKMIKAANTLQRHGIVELFKVSQSSAMRPDPVKPGEDDDATFDRQPQSAQGQTNNWRDQPVLRAPVEHVGGFTDSSLANSPFIGAPARANPTEDKTVAAIKTAWAQKKQNLAAIFANRPAARE